MTAPSGVVCSLAYIAMCYELLLQRQTAPHACEYLLSVSQASIHNYKATFHQEQLSLFRQLLSSPLAVVDGGFPACGVRGRRPHLCHTQVEERQRSRHHQRRTRRDLTGTGLYRVYMKSLNYLFL
jgi:hypothetical protein